jgi:hypothetical protein
MGPGAEAGTTAENIAHRSSLRAKRSNPRSNEESWIASSQERPCANASRLSQAVTN